MSLPQPQAASVQTHIVEDVNDWASFCELSGTLRLLDSQPDAVRSTISHQFSKDKLDACMFASALVVEHLHALFDAEERLPHLGRDPRTTIIGPFVMDVLKEVIPESEAHFDPLYARAIYPCQASMPAARWLLPHYGHATSILTYPISLPGENSSSALSRSLDGNPLNDQQGSADDEPGSASQYGKEGNELTSLTYGSFCSSGALFDRYRRPLGNAHLLSRHGYSRDHALLAILCVATEDEIYDLLCSALMQRRAFGIRDVVIGFTFSPQRSHIQLVVGWLEDSASHACVQVHVAHARPPRDGEQPAHALGIFDLSRLPSSQALALFLISICSHLLASADAASRQVADVDCPLRNADSGTWRIDLLHEVERNAARTCSLDPNRCVTKWLDHCMSAQSEDARLPHISYDNSPHIGEAPVAIATLLRGGSESAWSVAGLQPRYKGPDRFIELVADRGVAFDAFPTIFDKVGHVQENAVLKSVWDSLICPRICKVGVRVHVLNVSANDNAHHLPSLYQRRP
ncbi:hypothetical protein C8Q70DRAFT_1022603 [Cubamyces menziesii]|nr:hypothetical protein C8Q70DRAFT_1022603 [Cubamyces menziesii]